MASKVRNRITILPPSGWALPDFRELWAYRDLLFMLTARNVSLIYRQSVLGVGWAIVRPLVATAIFALVFGRFAGFNESTPNVAYPVFVLSGLVIWNFFSTSISSVAESVVTQSDILTKIYFPRLILPLSAVAVASIDFLIQIVILFAVMLMYGVTPATTAPLLLRAFDIEFNHEVVPLNTPEFDEYTKVNYPTLTVPTLQVTDGDTRTSIWDSFAIVEFLHEHHPDAGYWPEDPMQRALARSLSAEMHSSFLDLRGTMPTNFRRVYKSFQPSPEARVDIDRVIELWDWAASRWGDPAPYMFGERYYAVDAFYTAALAAGRSQERTAALEALLSSEEE